MRYDIKTHPSVDRTTTRNIWKRVTLYARQSQTIENSIWEIIKKEENYLGVNWVQVPKRLFLGRPRNWLFLSLLPFSFRVRFELFLAVCQRFRTCEVDVCMTGLMRTQHLTGIFHVITSDFDFREYTAKGDFPRCVVKDN